MHQKKHRFLSEKSLFLFLFGSCVLRVFCVCATIVEGQRLGTVHHGKYVFPTYTSLCVRSTRLRVCRHHARTPDTYAGFARLHFRIESENDHKHQKMRVESIKKNGKKTDGKQEVFNKFFLSKSVRKVPRVQNIKKCGWCRGCQTVKKRRVS